MGKYVDADALIAELLAMDGMICRDLADILAAVPAADVVPVVHARWEPGLAKYEELGLKTLYYCTACGRCAGFVEDTLKKPFCNCGARMDGKERAK